MNDVLFVTTVVLVLYLPVFGYIVYRIVKRYKKNKREREAQRRAEIDKFLAAADTLEKNSKAKSSPSPLKNLEVVDADAPVKVTSIAPDDEWETDPPIGELTPGSRIYRIYRSTDQSSWVECDPALTERAACNYGYYIKKSNPNEYVRVNDPDGLILYYE